MRHQLPVRQRQVGKPVFTETGRAILAGLLHHLPREKPRGPKLVDLQWCFGRRRYLLLLVRPDTVLRWHRDLLKRRHAATCVPRRRGRPPTVRSIRALVLAHGPGF
ncbi:hypothetical protein ABZV61_39755 [Streptomyces sp900116325]|uniref:Integrase n=1 Tax=Streptomyces sp. 900116325 TaxID=3154295 RepID=A0ABV2ULL7_9ACTN